MEENYNIQSNFTSCIFINNSATSALIDSMISELFIKNSTFESNFNIVILAIYSNIQLNLLFIQNHKCSLQDVGCFVNVQLTSIIELYEIKLINLISLLEEGNIYSYNSEIYIYNSSFTDVKSSKDKGACISLYASNLTIISSSFEGYDHNCIFSKEKSRILINYVIITNENFNISDTLSSYSSVYCEDCLIFNLTNSFLGYNSNSAGSALYLTSTKSINFFNSQEIFIQNCEFLFNKAFLNGGAIFIFDQNITLKSNNFTYNSASNGGAIFCANNSTIILLKIFNFLYIRKYQEFNNN